MPPSFGLMPELPERIRDKRARYGAYRDRALADLAGWDRRRRAPAHAAVARRAGPEPVQNIFCMAPEVREAFEHVREVESYRLEGRIDPRDIDVFWLRFERYFQDLYHPLTALYGERDDALDYFGRLVGQMVDAYGQRPVDLKRLDLERQFTPQWFQRSQMVGYTGYVDLFAGTLQGVRQKIPYLQELGVTYLHLMPLLEPREGPSDGGYAVKDYRKVRPDLGTLVDLIELADDLRARGISLCLDLVLNHVAQEHEWALRARAGEERYLNYFHTFPDRSLPDAYEHTLPEIFPQEAPGNFTWVEGMGGEGRWVWTTFNAYQWDLNYTNPEVFLEIVELMFFLANLGVDVLRLDAAPFLWKRMGTNCQNQPEVFQLIQAFRAIVRIVAPAVIFKAEAIVPPDALIRYLGVNSTVEKQCELAYNNQRMVLLWSALATGKVNLFTQVMHRAPQLLIGCAPINYIRNHDDIGWAMTDEDSAGGGRDASPAPALPQRLLHRPLSPDPSPAAPCSSSIPPRATPASPAPPPPWPAWSWPWSRAMPVRSTGPSPASCCCTP